MKRWLPLIAIAGALTVAPTIWAAADSADVHRLRSATDTLQDVLNAPDHGIPQGLLDHARCVIVMPNIVKAAFIIGGEGGRGVMECRTGEDFKGPWGAPAIMTLGGGSYGAQIGVEATDFVLLVMSDRGANSLLHDKVTLGANASAAAGPVGRSAAADIDVALQTDILTYSRAKGLFAGISLTGASLHSDDSANRKMYDRGTISAEEIVRGHAVQPPEAAGGLISLLEQQSPQRS